ncbi:MAG: FAD-binding oxidoreductase, partial [Cyclobacteriaceae bacterium]|nr:FAD-binding oxidoreductase [Cyclobacteriaceae bacterium HetDA_MAG_MS6]
MTDKKYDSIVIGGGIVGLFCAYYLGKKGHSVLILDKGPLEQASSHGNCGLVSPSHIMPLNSYELIVKSIGWLFKKDAPFHIKPQLDPRFIKWSLQFVQNASGKNVYKNAQAIHDIIISSRSLFAEVIEQEKIDCHWSADGIHFVFKYKKGFDQYKDTNDYTSQFGVSAQPIAGREIHEIEPALQDDVYGSWFYDIDAWLKPSELVAEMRKILAKNNVDILQGQEVTNFENSTSSIETITTKSGDTFAGQNYILATGAWSPLLGDQHGLKLPIIPGKGYSITMKSPSIVPQAPCIMMERKVV